jgi:monoamine oxidase
VPIGVLAAPQSAKGSIVFEPVPPGLEKAVSGLVMGSVVRMLLWFHRIPWKTESVERPVSFLHLPSGPFQALWLTHPFRWPLAVMWCGGSEARKLSLVSAPEAKRVMTAQLARALGKTPRRLGQDIRQVRWHNWERDPYARGAYAYVRVGAQDPDQALRRSVQSTLFFAGEATELEGGTVEAALVSGQRVARQVQRALA